MTRLVVVSIIFPPDAVSSAQLLGEIVTDISPSMESVHVVTTQPHYNSDALQNEEQPIHWGRSRLVGKSRYGDIEVTHLRMPQKSASKFGRILQWLWFHAGSLCILFAKHRRADAILTISPPPTVAIVCGLAKVPLRARLVYCVWEFYPDILIGMNVIPERSPATKVLRWVERWTYLLADEIAVLHPKMEKVIAERHPSAVPKLSVVPTFADVTFLRPSDRMTTLRERFGLGEEFVVGYAGNLGPSEDLTPLLNAASCLPEVTFLIAGDGTEGKALLALAESLNLSNVVFTGHLPYELVPELIATSDLAVVALTTGIGAEALPSKVYRSMACGRPILGISDRSSSLGEFIKECEIGVNVDPGAPVSTLVDAIQALASNSGERHALGTNARAIAVSRFSRDAVTSEFLRLVSGSPARPEPAP